MAEFTLVETVYENTKNKKIYGLTGSIATGKSFVSSLLKQLGAEIIDADKIAKQVIAKGSPVLKNIKKAFGVESINADGTLNRQFIRKLITTDKNARLKLNKITHPAIIKQENKLVETSKNSIIIVDAALLIESGSYKRFEKLILVYCKPEIQLKRLMKRDNLDLQTALKHINMQMPIDEKKEYADFIIDNSNSKEETVRQVKELYELL
jgi:dephospho-CoA kinase